MTARYGLEVSNENEPEIKYYSGPRARDENALLYLHDGYTVRYVNVADRTNNANVTASIRAAMRRIQL